MSDNGDWVLKKSKRRRGFRGDEATVDESDDDNNDESEADPRRRWGGSRGPRRALSGKQGKNTEISIPIVCYTTTSIYSTVLFETVRVCLQ